jgi:hypothetical protein
VLLGGDAREMQGVGGPRSLVKYTGGVSVKSPIPPWNKNHRIQKSFDTDLKVKVVGLLC